MPLGLSLYLDVLRFGLAMVVMIGHSTYGKYTGHPFALWFVAPYRQTAVVAFFVLSGFVIAHASASGGSVRKYTVARISRLYPMIILALMLTFACDTAGQWLDPALYHGDNPAAIGDNQIMRYISTAFLVNSFAVFGYGDPGTNGPFWSLSYEMAYYVVFGLYLTGKRPLIVAGPALVFIAAGWKILALFPIWVAGVIVYRLQTTRPMPVLAAAVIWPLSVVLLIRVGWIRETVGAFRAYHLDYVEALLVATNIYATSALSGWFGIVLAWCRPIIRWLGSLTFGIYLCHIPLFQFLTAIRIDQPGTPREQAWLFGSSFLVIVAIASLADQMRAALRRVLLRRARNDEDAGAGRPAWVG
jgi:peptidoglycan/LPS O-acetylase OafA/YrhL